MSTAKITEIHAVLVRLPIEHPIVAPFGTVTHRHNLLVIVETAAGARGIGEVWANFPPWGCSERVNLLLHGIRPQLLGEVLDEPLRIHRRLREHFRGLANQLGAPGPVHQVLAGVDIALWDCHARAAGARICDLVLGRRAPDRVPVYATNLGAERAPRAIERARSLGFTRFKINLRGDPQADALNLRAARVAAGGDPLMADASQSYGLERIEPLVEVLQEVALTWLEEPFPVDDVASYRAWAGRPGRPPLAMGENSYGFAGIDLLLRTIGPDVVQPDITKTAGISEGREIAHHVVASRRRLCLHMYGGPVGLLASAHLMSAIEGAWWLEMDGNPNPLFEELLDEPFSVENGALRLPEMPGLGCEIRDTALARWRVAPSE